MAVADSAKKRKEPSSASEEAPAATSSSTSPSTSGSSNSSSSRSKSGYWQAKKQKSRSNVRANGGGRGYGELSDKRKGYSESAHAGSYAAEELARVDAEPGAAAALEALPKLPKRCVALLFGYCGAGYMGMQINPGMKT